VFGAFEQCVAISTIIVIACISSITGTVGDGILGYSVVFFTQDSDGVGTIMTDTLKYGRTDRVIIEVNFPRPVFGILTAIRLTWITTVLYVIFNFIVCPGQTLFRKILAHLCVSDDIIATSAFIIFYIIRPGDWMNMTRSLGAREGKTISTIRVIACLSFITGTVGGGILGYSVFFFT
jgi:hypothetical protein